jgi:hypothetical protein
MGKLLKIALVIYFDVLSNKIFNYIFIFNIFQDIIFNQCIMLIVQGKGQFGTYCLSSYQLDKNGDRSKMTPKINEIYLYLYVRTPL